MYKFERYRQLGLANFKQPVGLKMNPKNRWIKKGETIPWDAIEKSFPDFFQVKPECRQNLSGWHSALC